MDKKTLGFSYRTLLVLTSVVLFSCGGGDDKGVPPTTNDDKDTTQPSDPEVTGVITIGPVENASVSISEITVDKTVTPIKITTTLISRSTARSNSQGEYTIAIPTISVDTPVVVCASSGSYREPAGSAAVVNKTFTNTEELCAIAIYKADKDLIVNITYFTHLAYGVMNNRLLSGGPVMDRLSTNQDGSPKIILGSISSSNKIIGDWLQLNTVDNNQAIITINPIDITQNTNIPSTINNELKYGVAIAGISSLVEWLRSSNPSTYKLLEFEQVSTIALAQLIYQDISDAVLDGQVNSSNGKTRVLFLGEAALNAHNLRYHFAIRMLSVIANRAINKTGFKTRDLNEYIKAVNNFPVLFENNTLVEIINTEPFFTHIYPNNNGIINGDSKISIDVSDITDIASISLTIVPAPKNGVPVTNIPANLPSNLFAANPEQPEWPIVIASAADLNAPGIPNGIYTIQFEATNNNNTKTLFEIPEVQISNSPISIIITNPPKVDLTRPITIPRNSIASLVGFEAVVDDLFLLPEGSSVNSAVQFFILSGVSPFDTIATLPFEITAANPNGYAIRSDYSRKYFASANPLDIIAPNDPITLLDGKYKLKVTAISDKDVTPLLEADPVTVDFEYDTQIPSAAFDTLNETVFSGPVIIAATITDPVKDGYASGIKTQLINHDGNPTAISIPLNATETTLTLDPEGWHQVTLDVADYAGNVLANSEQIVVGYDITPPTVKIVKASIANNWWNKLDIITNVTDNETGIKSIEYGVDIVDPTAVTIGQAVTLPTTVPPEKTTTFKLTDVDVQTNLTDGVHDYFVRSSDFVTLLTHNVNDQILNIGIDTTQPTINFVTEAVSGTAFPAASGVQSAAFVEVATLPNNVTIDIAAQSAAVTWSIAVDVSEPGYETPTINQAGTEISRTATASGLGSVFDGATGILITSDNLISVAINSSKSTTISNLAQYEVSSTAAIEVIWDAIATCEALSDPANNTMIINRKNECEEQDSRGRTVTDNNGNNLPLEPIIYEWTKGAISYPGAADTSNRADLLLPASFVSTQTVFDITATDKTQPIGNTTRQYACLNFTIQNSTSDAILVTRPASDIAVDAGASEPTAPGLLDAPSNVNCNEAITPLIPVVVVANAVAGVNSATCTMTSASSTQLNAILTASLASSQTFAIEVQTETPVDPIVAVNTPPVCP